jgi:hypothetical protein
MIKALPDKYIRKAIFTAVNGIVVNTKTILCYDTKATSQAKDNYIILSTQSNEVDKSVKCGYRWESSILIDIITRYSISGNTGSRLLADDILDKVREVTDSLVLDVESGLTIVTQSQSFPNDLVSETQNEIIYRKLIRIEFLIN